MEKLKNNSIYNYEDYPKIFGVSEAEIFEVMEAYNKYHDGDKSQSMLDWGQMYKGVHKESTYELELRGWLACYRWMVSMSKVSNWILTDKQEKIVFGCEVIGFHPSWIHEDYNPNGTRLGFFQEGIDEPFFVSISWDNESDSYETDESVIPSHYINMPNPKLQI